MPKELKQSSLPSLPSTWAMEPHAFHNLLPRLALPATKLSEAILAYWGDYDDEDETAVKKPYTIKDGVARIDLKGTLLKEDSFWTWWLGGTSLSSFQKKIQMAASDAEVTSILLVIDSPGGTLDGTPAAANAVTEARKSKTVNAHVDGCCCSAAYWIASQCDKITANPESDVANIGIYTTVTDVSEMLASEGIEKILVATGKYKGAGVWGVAVTDAHREQFQSLVDSPFVLFKDAVQNGRSLSKSQLKEVSEGFVYMAENAVELGLIDKTGYMADGVPPSCETPTTTEDGTPPAPPSDDNEEQTMNPDEQKKTNFLQWLFAGFGGGQSPAPQTASDTPPPTVVTSPPQVTTTDTTQWMFGTNGSQIEAAPGFAPAPYLAGSPEFEEQKALLEQLRQQNAQLQEQMNALRMDEYVRAGKVTPAQRETQSKLRLANPQAYDAAMADVPVHPAFDNTGATAPAANTVDGQTLLQQMQAQSNPNGEGAHAETVTAHIEKMNKLADAPNPLKILIGGSR